jgi:putative CocE/NonD family hydrolase
MSFKSVLLYIFLLGVCCPIASTQNVSESNDNQGFVHVQKDMMIPASDGVNLATDIYRPAKDGVLIEGSFPMILQRTPYGKSNERFTKTALHLVQKGYVVALQDLRGRYESGGEFTKYSPLEASDGAATVEFLSALPYIDGRVGMFGTSYGAHTQADASKLNPKGLAAMVINMGGMTNAWDHAVRQGGAFELGRELTWAFRQIPAEIRDTVVQLHFEKETINEWYSVWPFRKGLSPLSIAPNFEEYILEEATHSDYDDYWKETGINWQEYYDQTADVPMVHIGGWYDIFLRGTIENFMTLDSLQSSPKWLILGPWTHSGNSRTYAGDVDFGPSAAIPGFESTYQGLWFDYILKGIKNEALTTSPIQIFMMGGGEGTKDSNGRLKHGGHWLNLEQWPPQESEGRDYYLRGDGDLSVNKENAEGGKTTFTFDPSHPVPTLGGNVSARVKDGAFNQRERSDFIGSSAPYLPLKARQDIVVFQTDPLEDDTHLVGPIEVELFCSSSALDTDFTVKLIDVYPPSEDFPEGFEMNLTDGVVRMSYRNGRHERDLIEPNKIYSVKIEPFPTANIFKKGHRIRVDISSSNFPRWDVNPNTGEPLGKNRRMIKADNTIYHSAEYPSKIVLPIFKKE